MKTHIIEAGVVVNTILATVAEAESAFPSAICVAGDTGGIGWAWDGAALTPPPAPTPPPLTLADYDAALTAHLDAEAQTRRYADRVSCSVRAGYVGPFQAEGIAFAQWMDRQNQIAYQMLEDFMTGLIPQPTVEEFIASLDVMVWP